jgi:chromosome segregation ATPase
MINKVENIERMMIELQSEVAKIREPKKAAKKDYLDKIVKLLTGPQLSMYNRMYPNSPKNLDIAISQVEATLKQLNDKTDKLHEEKEKAEADAMKAYIETTQVKTELKGLYSALKEAQSEIRRLSTPENLAIADVQRQLDLLQALESAGVDNWSGYDYAMEIFRGEEE